MSPQNSIIHFVSHWVHSRLIPLFGTGLLAALFSQAVVAEASQAESESESSEQPAKASPWNWGVGLFASGDVYKGFDRRVIPFPMVVYRGERFHLYGPFARYNLFKAGEATLSLQMNPVFAGYEASDSPALEGMADRDYSMTGGLAAEYRPGGWELNASTTYDLLSVYQGYQSSMSIAHASTFGKYRIEPGFTSTWQSAEYVDYYYGVTASEARTDRPEYKAKGAFNYQYSLAVSRLGIWGGAVRLQVSRTHFGKAISDSPITDSKTAMALSLMYSRFL